MSKAKRNPAALEGFAAAAFTGMRLVMTAVQTDWLAKLAPSLHALAAGTKPPITRFWTEMTKGHGKTTMLAIAVCWLLAYCTRLVRIQVGAADQDQAAELILAANKVVQAVPFLRSRIVVDRWAIKCPATGSVCEILAADIAGSHGASPDLLILDEIVHITKILFAQNILDNSDKLGCRSMVIVASNAGFTGTWAYQLREIARTSPRWDFTQVTAPASQISPAALDEARRRNTQERFRRLFEGIWSAGSGDAFDEEDLEAAVKPTLAPMDSTPKGWGASIGLDLSVKHDHSALVVLLVNGETDRIRLALCQSWKPGVFTKRVDLSAVEQAVLDAHRRFGGTVNYDPHQAALMVERLSKKGVPLREVPFSGQNLNRMASDMLDVFRSRRIDLYPDKELLRDLRRLTITEKSYGYKLESTRDADGHADRAVAMALALLGIPEAAIRPTGSWGLFGVPSRHPWPNAQPNQSGGPVYHEKRGFKIGW